MTHKKGPLTPKKYLYQTIFVILFSSMYLLNFGMPLRGASTAVPPATAAATAALAHPPGRSQPTTKRPRHAISAPPDRPPAAPVCPPR